MKSGLMFYCLFVASIGCAVEKPIIEKVYHIQTDDDQNVYAVVEYSDNSWDLGSMIEGCFKIFDDNVKVSIDEVSNSLLIRDKENRESLYDVVGVHSSTDCMPRCSGCKE